MSVGGLDEESV